MLAKLQNFVNHNRDLLTLIAIIFLAALFAFAIGYLLGSYTTKEPLIVE